MASGLILHCCWIFIIRLDDDKNKNEENYVLVMVSIVGDVGGDDGGGDHDGGDDLGEDVCNSPPERSAELCPDSLIN